jgi:hypothetical protein
MIKNKKNICAFKELKDDERIALRFTQGKLCNRNKIAAIKFGSYIYSPNIS